MPKDRPPKKTEFIEVRLPDETKRAFMARCREQGRSASEVVRGFVDDFLAEPPPQPRKARPAMALIAKPAALAVACGAILFASTLVPGAVSAAPDLRAAFSRLDRDNDGALSFDEFGARAGQDVLFVARDAAPPPAGTRPFMLPLPAGIAPAAPSGGTMPPPDLLRTEFARQDADASGAVSFGEFAAFHERLLRAGFDDLDRDRSGGIDPAELAASLRALPSDLPRPDFSALDRNRDGRIAFDEFVG